MFILAFWVMGDLWGIGLVVTVMITVMSECPSYKGLSLVGGLVLAGALWRNRFFYGELDAYLPHQDFGLRIV